ncbi:MAG TPA: NYN domain-containing protein [Phototrophicaceae bacterium]|nr:NYN domain-containing protein [Phototrophicaceae bacterium]
MEPNRRLALLIDGDNAQAALIPQILAEVTKYGTMTIRRVYGDWTEPNMKGWKEVMHTHALQPIQQFRYTVGKNATDSTLIIDAMDILYTAGVDGICLASSDSDYTRLATRIREKNLFVLGIGRNLTPRAFVNACDVFVYTENLGTETVSNNTGVTPALDTERVQVTGAKNTKTDLAKLKPLFKTAFDLATQEDGWAHLSALGTSLRQLDPAFDPRTYGHKQLSQLVQAADFIEVRENRGSSGSAVFYVRPKQKAKPTKKP